MIIHDAIFLNTMILDAARISWIEVSIEECLFVWLENGELIKLVPEDAALFVNHFHNLGYDLSENLTYFLQFLPEGKKMNSVPF